MNLGPVELIVLFLFLLVPLTFGYVAGKVWQSKGGDFWLLFVVGLILPVVGLLIAFLASPGATSPRNVIAVVKVLDKDRRYIGTGNHTGFSPAGEAIIEVPPPIYDEAALAEDLHGPIKDVSFKKGR